MRTANPALNEKTFDQYEVYDSSSVMTVEGTAIKTSMLLLLVVLAAGYTWNIFATQGPQAVGPWMMGGMLGGFVVAMITIFKPVWSPYTSPIYAVAEGLFLGGLSAIVQSNFPEVPIVLQAVCLTFGTMFALLIAYQTHMIRATENFKLGIFAATGGICLVYLASFILGFFNIHLGFIHSAGPIGIAFSLFVVVIAALNLVLDFDFIEEGAARGAPKYMEWYSAFGLLVTLVWLYIEILRLLSKLNRRN